MSPLGTKLVSIAIIGFSLVGCNAGMAPQGASGDDVKAAFDKLPLEDKVKITKQSSMPEDKKKAKIEEYYKAAGKTPPDDGAGGGTAGGPPPGTGMPSQGGR
jgi:hypothetical protein